MGFGYDDDELGTVAGRGNAAFLSVIVTLSVVIQLVKHSK
jgi:hypothetical protein